MGNFYETNRKISIFTCSFLLMLSCSNEPVSMQGAGHALKNEGESNSIAAVINGDQD